MEKKISPVKKISSSVKKRPVSSSILLSMGLGCALCILESVIEMAEGHSALFYPDVFSVVIIGFITGAFFVYPGVLTLIHFISLFLLPKTERHKKAVRRFEYITILLGLLYSWISNYYFMDIAWDAEWSKQLYDPQVHQPLWTGAVPTFIVMCLAGGIGYFVLSRIKVEKTPPLVIVSAMAAMYLGVFESVMWCIQLLGMNLPFGSGLEAVLLCLFPFDFIMISIKTIRLSIYEWNAVKEQKEQEPEAVKEKSIWNFLDKKLRRAAYWPALAFLFMWPLLGILFCILMLFGQKPDYVIKVFTETAQWRLSARTAPPNLPSHGHYLCTVAACGHEKLVKPTRMGERHGKAIVVNRQLCIANAFEQILEEKTPGLHKHVRHFYDTYGFPIAVLIRTKWAADVVYLLMKPLEWVFLMVIYFCDAKPENRIAVQYLPKGEGK